ncbi:MULTISPECIES: hypothetical protein [unclassified Sphingobacterium]|uniref:hypothetical protein n=1 Tax=unclassified Sphingobacterium TaxID=2609468 RepID=UPI0025F850CE|nr:MULTISPECIES: hypothetical protein [unclassified Sphingobacterium]
MAFVFLPYPTSKQWKLVRKKKIRIHPLAISFRKTVTYHPQHARAYISWQRFQKHMFISPRKSQLTKNKLKQEVTIVDYIR